MYTSTALKWCAAFGLVSWARSKHLWKVRAFPFFVICAIVSILYIAESAVYVSAFKHLSFMLMHWLSQWIEGTLSPAYFLHSASRYEDKLYPFTLGHEEKKNVHWIQQLPTNTHGGSHLSSRFYVARVLPQDKAAVYIASGSNIGLRRSARLVLSQSEVYPISRPQIFS